MLIMNGWRAAALAIVLTSVPARAEVIVTDAWIRGTVGGQKSTGAFMQLRSTTDTSLVGIASTVAQSAELHETKSEGGMMKMRPMNALALPAGKMVELKPGGYHVMLVDLTQALKAGETIPLTLTFQARDGRRSTMSVQAAVRPLTALDARH